MAARMKTYLDYGNNTMFIEVSMDWLKAELKSAGGDLEKVCAELLREGFKRAKECGFEKEDSDGIRKPD